jgi:hypothetical protein
MRYAGLSGRHRLAQTIFILENLTFPFFQSVVKLKQSTCLLHLWHVPKYDSPNLVMKIDCSTANGNPGIIYFLAKD